MLQAVKDGHLITWPGLTEDAIKKHLKLTPATAMRYMNQRRQNILSTSKAPAEKQQSPVMVCYIYDCNYVKVIPMKSRSASEWVKEYDSVHKELIIKGFKLKLQTLNNEASAALQNYFTVNDIAYQLVPPHCHRRNAA
jgi:hypothetical protein